VIPWAVRSKLAGVVLIGRGGFDSQDVSAATTRANQILMEPKQGAHASSSALSGAGSLE
jgi:hypothetical protein